VRLLLALALLGAFVPQASTQGMHVQRLDPALDSLIAPGTEPELVAGPYTFTEGPMWRDGQLWFSDEEGDKVHSITPDGKDTVLVDFTTGPYARSGGAKTGPNAMATAPDGSVVMCEQYARAMVRLIGMPGPLTPIPLFDSYDGHHLNSPNDLVFLPDGTYFFTDPNYGLKQGAKDPAKQLPYQAVFHVRDGKPTPVIKDLATPNGIALSPDNRTLYVNNSGPDQRIVAYDLHPDGTVSNARNLITFTGHEGPGVPDGMKIDSHGNVWSSGPGGIRIITPEGKVLGQIQLPEIAANAAWGGSDGTVLYITARTHIYRLQTRVKGFLPAFPR
jgi:gluconolactonase